LNRIRARKEEEFYKKSFLFRGEKSQDKGRPNAPKSSFFLSLFCVVCVYFRSLAECSLAAYSFTSFFNSFVSSDKHATHGGLDITNWKTTLDTQDNRERDTERKRKRERYVVLLQLLFCFFCRVFLRANEDDVERRRRTTTTSKEADDDEADEQENGKDTSLKLRDDDECIETRQNDDE
jgi:hypothetical protein